MQANNWKAAIPVPLPPRNEPPVETNEKAYLAEQGKELFRKFMCSGVVLQRQSRKSTKSSSFRLDIPPWQAETPFSP